MTAGRISRHFTMEQLGVHQKWASRDIVSSLCILLTSPKQPLALAFTFPKLRLEKPWKLASFIYDFHIGLGSLPPTNNHKHGTLPGSRLEVFCLPRLPTRLRQLAGTELNSVQAAQAPLRPLSRPPPPAGAEFFRWPAPKIGMATQDPSFLPVHTNCSDAIFLIYLSLSQPSSSSLSAKPWSVSKSGVIPNATWAV